MRIQCSISLLLKPGPSPPLPPNLPQGCLTEMTNYTASEVLNFLLHFIYPYGLHPSPRTCTLHPRPKFRHTRGTTPLLCNHTTKWHQVNLSQRISSHLPYVTIRSEGLALWGGRAVRCGLAQSRNRETRSRGALTCTPPGRSR
jgi:hypothetical protein